MADVVGLDIDGTATARYLSSAGGLRGEGPARLAGAGVEGIYRFGVDKVATGVGDGAVVPRGDVEGAAGEDASSIGEDVVAVLPELGASLGAIGGDRAGGREGVDGVGARHHPALGAVV